MERYLNSAALKVPRVEVGEDIKVTGIRLANRTILTIGCALISRQIASAADYHAKKANIATLARQAGKSNVRWALPRAILCLGRPDKRQPGNLE